MAGVRARGASIKIWDPLLIYATVEASNFKFGMQLEFGTSLPKNTTWVRAVACQKQRLAPKLAGVWAREASKKIWNPLRIFATVEASNFKFGALKLGLEVAYQKRWLAAKLGGGLGQGSIQKNSGLPTYFCNR